MLLNIEKLLFFLLILFLPTQLGKHFWFDFSQVFSLRVDYLALTIYFWDFLSLSLLVIYISRKAYLNKTALNLALVFILAQVLSLIWATNTGAGFARLLSYTSALWFGVYVSSQKDQQIWTKMKTTFLFALCFEGALGILQVINKGSIGFWVLGERSFNITTPAIAKFDFSGFELLRAYATFSHPNVFGAYLLIGLVVLIFGYRRLIWREWPVVLISIVGTVLTFSRGAILFLMVTLLYYLNKKGKVLLLICLTIFSPILAIRFGSIFNYDLLSIVRRQELSQIAINFFVNNPIFGVGLNNFIPMLSGNLLSGPNRFLQPVHNIYLLSLSETGVVGLVALVLLIGLPLYGLLRSSKNNRRFALLICWTICLLTGLIDHYFLTLPQGQRLLFLLWGLSWYVIEYPNDNTTKDRHSNQLAGTR